MRMLPHVISEKVSETMQISTVGKARFNDRIYMTGETEFRIKQYTQILNNIIQGEAVSQNVHRKGIFEPFMLIHRTKDYKLSFSRIHLSLFSNIQIWISSK